MGDPLNLDALRCLELPLLMNGVNIREVQELLGHKNVETTMIYTHVLRDMSHAPQIPLDILFQINERNSAKAGN